MQSFIFGGDNMPKTPQELARMRAVADALVSKRTPQNVGEGLSAIGDAIVYRSMMSKADGAEKAGIESANSLFSSLFGTPGAPADAAAPSTTPAYTPEPVAGTMENGRTADRNSVPDYAAQPSVDISDLGKVESYIREAAQQRGINPDIAVKVARAEGLAPGVWQSNVKKNGMREPSYGPFQMLVGDGKNFQKGMGNDFMAKTGLDPRDPSTVQKQIDFALDQAKTTGWRPWYGAKAAGLGVWDGINANQVASTSDAVTASAVPEKKQTILSALLGGGQKPAQVQQPAAQTQVAQALMGGQNIDQRKLMEAINNPYLSDAQRSIVGALLKQQMERQDPAYQMGIENDRLGLEKNRLELEALKNPAKMRNLTDDEEKAMGLDPAGVYQSDPSGKISVLRDAPNPTAAIDLQLKQAELDAKKNPAKMRMLTDDEKKMSGLDPAGAYQVDPAGKISILKDAPDPLKPTTAMQEYDAAKAEGYKGTFTDWKLEQNRSSASQVNVDNGTIPAGYQATRDADGRIIRLEPIPGSPAADAAAAAEDKGKLAGDLQARKTDVIADDIDRALSVIGGPGLPSTGAGSFLSSIPGTNAKKLDGLLTTLKANISFDKLNEMRQSSPTGGALGSVTVEELKMLSATIGSLDQSQDDETLKYNLNRVWNAYQDVIHGKGNGPARRELNAPLNSPTVVQPTDENIPPPPEGVDPEDWKHMPPEARKLWQN